MISAVVKRSITINGHKTSVSLEQGFWNALRDIAHSRGETLSDLVARIDAERKHKNLSSAIRLFVLGFYREQCIKKDLEVTLGRGQVLTPH
jgi:predicted DNA-binding ribbon-helix-helix protein